MDYNIICMKWGSKYGPEYVNRLRAMAERNLTLPHKFVCFTDDATGVDPRVEIRPLPQMSVPGGAERCWRKLSTLMPGLGGLKGRCIFLDLDIVIVSNIDEFFTVDGDFLVIKEWNKRRTHGLGNSSVYRFEVGAHADILEYFAENSAEVVKNHRHEQSFLTSMLQKQGKLAYWPAGWCASFKYGCMRPFPQSLFEEARIPDSAKIIIFHGYPTPDDAIAGKIRGCKKLFRFLRPTTWIKDYWKD